MEIRPELWDSLESALLLPETADLRSLFIALDAELAEQPPERQLAIAGQVMADLCAVYCDRSSLMLERWEQRHNPAEPIINLDDDAEFFVQSSVVVVEDLFEAPGHQYPVERQPASQPDTEMPDVETLEDVNEHQPTLSEAELAEQVTALAHGENIEAWTATIVTFLDAWFAVGHDSIPLVELTRQIAMPFMEVWLGLLLGTHNYQLSSNGNFYDRAAIAVQFKEREPGAPC